MHFGVRKMSLGQLERMNHSTEHHDHWKRLWFTGDGKEIIAVKGNSVAILFCADPDALGYVAQGCLGIAL